MWASLVAQRLKRLPPMLETWVRSLDQEESPGEGNGNPLQYSPLGNSMDRGAWQATVHGCLKRGGLKLAAKHVLFMIIYCILYIHISFSHSHNLSGCCVEKNFHMSISNFIVV